MNEISIYEQVFAAGCVFNGVMRRAALVKLIAATGEGRVRYEAAVTFFPHSDDEDYAISYDAYFSKVLYDAPGRRSKKRERQFFDELRGHIDELAKKAGGEVMWDRPLRDPRFA